MQDLVHMGILRLKKISGEQNHSDVLTQFVKLDALRKHIHDMELCGSRGIFKIHEVDPAENT